MAIWWIANVIGLVVVIPLVILLAGRIVRRLQEAAGYSDEILTHGVLLAGNLDPVPALGDSRDLVEQATGSAVRYVTALTD